MIRVAAADDAAEIRRIYAPAVRQEVISFETVVPPERELQQRVPTTLERFPWLVRVGDQGLLGFGYASSHRLRDAYRWSVEVSVYVDADCRRQGCGRQRINRLFAILAAQGFYSAFAGIAVPNKTSQAFHESLGFQQVGVFPGVAFKQGAWRDVGWWYRWLNDTWASEPAVPSPFSQWLAANLDCV